MPDRRTIARAILVSIPSLLVLAQLVPYGRTHENPPVVADAPWDSPRTKELFYRSCGDCHSNRTAWPWYSLVAPVSWILQRDVAEGRRRLNVSEFGTRPDSAHLSASEVEDKEMPPEIYTLLHPAARLSDGERRELAHGLAGTFGTKAR